LKGEKFPTRAKYYIPPYLEYFAKLPCEVTGMFNMLQNWKKMKTYWTDFESTQYKLYSSVTYYTDLIFWFWLKIF